MTNDLIERLRSAETCSVQTIHGSDIFKQAADEIQRLRADRQKYYNEASEGWTKFRKAEARIAELESQLDEHRAHHERYHLDCEIATHKALKEG